MSGNAVKQNQKSERAGCVRIEGAQAGFYGVKTTVPTGKARVNGLRIPDFLEKRRPRRLRDRDMTHNAANRMDAIRLRPQICFSDRN